ncbi:uncharacterized protein LOC123878127 isoform X2 [Maniola jurtina]|uniref:uncharacterized protein LOC123878127 isoform X2 n=1 Tax=Maniola jurtina TaxID=191418 RepID=UPI001E687A57|nr:uncharacterized protein LOC123878127 isoform X2 [Maniola jurtina]
MKVLGVFACICVLIAATSAQEPDEQLVGILEESDKVVGEGLEELATIDEDTGRRQARSAGRRSARGRRGIGTDLFGKNNVGNIIDKFAPVLTSLGSSVMEVVGGLRSIVSTFGSFIPLRRRQLQDEGELIAEFENLGDTVSEVLENMLLIDDGGGELEERRKARSAGRRSARGRRGIGTDLFGKNDVGNLIDKFAPIMKTLGSNLVHVVGGVSSIVSSIGQLIPLRRRQLQDDLSEGELISILEELGQAVGQGLEELEANVEGDELEGRRQADPPEANEILENVGTVLQKGLEHMQILPNDGEDGEETLAERRGTNLGDRDQGPPDGRRFFLDKLFGNAEKSVLKGNKRSIDEPKPRSRRFLSPEKLEKVVRAGLEALFNDSEEESGKNEREGDEKEQKSNKKSHRSRRNSPPNEENLTGKPLPEQTTPELPADQITDELTPLPVELSNVRVRRNAVRRSV